MLSRTYPIRVAPLKELNGMEYSVRLKSLDHVPLDLDGSVRPLCDSCMSADCTNPIARTKVSIFGREETFRLYKYGSSYKMVIDCDGYMKIPDKTIENECDED